MSSVLRAGLPANAPDPFGAGRDPGSTPATPPASLLAASAAGAGAGRGGPGAPHDNRQTLNVIAGVGVLLLAMGVGVLIGRSSNGSAKPAAPQVISVASAPTSTGTGTTSSTAEPTFSDDWPSGKKGFTVQLEALPQSGAKVTAVQAAKSAASGKGAKGVGALKSEDFSSLTAGSYVIYSGVYTKKAEAEKALPGLKKNFPSAKVIEVSSGGAIGEAGESNKVGESFKKPAPSSVLEKVNKAKGKSYVQKSKELPNVISTE
ncbi:MAG TPA: hypothetical protein VHU13_07590 [Solirubrobacteraceae bacterium]|jgi:hypothetical protein|nr:hypothetical protein [Solirubrobacteraceae bacterium]